MFNSIAKVLSIVALLFGLLFGTGCQTHNANETVEEQRATHDQNLETARAWAKLGKESGAAYMIQIDSTGRPSGGLENRIVVDTGVAVHGILFGNMAWANGLQTPQEVQDKLNAEANGE